MSFLREIETILENNQVTISDGGLSPMQDGEHLVGECSQRIKTVISLMSKIKDDLGDREECLSVTDQAKERELYERYSTEHHVLEHKHGLLRSLMWVLLYEEHPELTLKNAVAVRQGWKIVYLDKVTVDDLEEPDRGCAQVIIATPSMNLAGKN